MIGSHDTYTYLKPKCSIYKAFSGTWKTQNRTIEDQYEYGVRMFDIHIVWDNGYWVPAHGLVVFDGKKWPTLRKICREMNRKFPEAIYRIILERGNKGVESVFKAQAKGLCACFPNLWRIIIKKTKNWKGIMSNDTKLYNEGYLWANNETWEAPAFEIRGYAGLKSLKSQAKKLNKDNVYSTEKSTLYLIDYCTEEYD